MPEAPGPPLPATLAEAHAVIVALWPLVARVEELRILNAKLEARVEELERRLGQNSQNSSKPPSSDGPHVKVGPKKESSGKKPGGQPGHPGHHRDVLPIEKVDFARDHWPERCGKCRGPLPDGGRNEVGAPEHRQVTEIPEVLAEVTDHLLHRVRCHGCGAETRAVLPADVPPGAFGPRLTAVVALLAGAYRMSDRTVSEVLGDLFGARISVGSVVACQQAASSALAPAAEEARDYVRAQPVAHGDETSWWEARKKAWLWVLATPLVAFFVVQARRNRKAAKEMLASFRGILSTDRWAAYNVHIGIRQLCWSHLRRDFQALSEFKGWTGKRGKNLVRLARRMFRLWHRVRDGTLARPDFQLKIKPIRNDVEETLIEIVKSAVPRASGMCRDIGSHMESLWTFVDREGVEPTNNLAERVLRPAVLHRKSSFGTHSPAGSRFVERMFTVRATMRLQGRSVVEFVTHAVRASFLGHPIPSLLPSVVPPAVRAAV